MLQWMLPVLLQAKEWERAERLIRSLPVNTQVEALSDLAVALARAEERERAQEFSTRVEQMIRMEVDDGERNEAVLELCKMFATIRQWEHIEMLVPSVEEGRAKELLKETLFFFSWRSKLASMNERRCSFIL